MKAWLLRTAGIVAIVLTGLGSAGCQKAADTKAKGGGAKGGAAKATATETVTAADVMRGLNRRQSGLHNQLGTALKADSIDWSMIQPKAQEYATLAAALGRTEPAKGDKASWEALTTTFAENARALNAAIQKNDKDAALNVHDQISQSCMTCHQAHRP